ncbi:MAG: AAA family ATPase [Deltaproteobacteria bacterium]|nr:AAA family ATPase [Deltaproteobacteria bacterium]
MKQLPLGNQFFAEIRAEDLFYVDKTEYIYNLLKNSKNNYFLSRPRRFGTTLLLTTIEELFSGNRKPFEGLWIDSSDYAFPKRPVIYLSLSMEADTPKILCNNILFKLREIAAEENLAIAGDSPGAYFIGLINALYDKYKVKSGFNPEVAILIDNYDAPVTRNMDNLAVAKANNKILQDFFATLKDEDVAPCIRFTLVTGVTRYGLPSMDSGLNHLNDISLEPEYNGICGFSADDFDALFADRMEEVLPELIKTGWLEPSATQQDLKAEILRWYNGYNWGGETRMLNPISILNFFQRRHFEKYWIHTGRPAHLTPLIKEKPEDFFEPGLKSCLSRELRNSELEGLQVAPFLFHTGYLTLAKTTLVKKINPLTNEEESDISYSFKLPNYEVSSDYNLDWLEVIFNIGLSHVFSDRRVLLEKAILARDVKTVEDIFTSFFSAVTSIQRPNDEKAFHSLLRMSLFGMRFYDQSELLGTIGGFDICFELRKQILVIIELKYSQDLFKLKPKDEERILANLAAKKFLEEERDNIFAKLSKNKLDIRKTYRIVSEGRENNLSEAEINKLLIQAAKALPRADIEQALAIEARYKFSEEEIDKASREANPDLDIAQKALDSLLSKDYHGQLKRMGREIINLGLGVYDYGSEVKAAFGPK